jgi:hypothetical protein
LSGELFLAGRCSVAASFAASLIDRLANQRTGLQVRFLVEKRVLRYKNGHTPNQIGREQLSK